MLSKIGKNYNLITFHIISNKIFDLYNEREVKPGLKNKQGHDIA